MVCNLIECIGIIAGICTTAGFIPQVYKTWKTKSVRDISLLMYAVLCTGMTLWILYGVIMSSPAIIFSNIVSLILLLLMLSMKLRYEKP